MSADLPYAGTSGWSGTDTSEERARDADESGTTGKRQRRVLAVLEIPQEYGITVTELRGITGWHHGTASGTLSVLHKAGRIARLTDKRERCHVYVLPEYVDGRETQSHGRQGTVTISKEEYRQLLRDQEAWHIVRDRS